jgi:hypothetical protein
MKASFNFSILYLISIVLVVCSSAFASENKSKSEDSYRNGTFIRTTEHSKNILDEFSTDGCSMYPDENPE